MKNEDLMQEKAAHDDVKDYFTKEMGTVPQEKEN